MVVVVECCNGYRGGFWDCNEFNKCQKNIDNYGDDIGNVMVGDICWNVVVKIVGFLFVVVGDVIKDYSKLHSW